VHESRLVADLIAQAEARAPGPPHEITRLKLRIGALAAATPAALEHGVGELATSRWGARPDIEIEQGHDPTDPAALGVVLVALGVRSAATAGGRGTCA
jgi:Zn finger protein HypA/HybF involved in hydrogenase expression